MKKVLITDSVHPLLIEGFESMGYHCEYNPDISLEEVRSIVSAYEGLIINSKILVDKQLLDTAPLLKFVGRLGSGMEIIDQPYAAAKGVGIFNSPEGNRNAVGEQAVGMLLMLANNLLRSDRQLRQKIWKREQNRGFELMGKTVGIIGFGHTGSSFARKLQGFDVKVLAYDKYKQNYTESFDYVTESHPREICNTADIISFHLPLTNETIHLGDSQFFNSCKKGCIIINTSRGIVVNTADLIEALESGQVGGACLDVFENEKPATFDAAEHALYDKLYSFEQLVLSPHIAGWTYESKARMAEVLLIKIQKFLNQQDIQ